MDRPLQGQHAVVTGASKGIGAAVAARLAAAGANLSLTARHEGDIQAVAATLATEHGVTATGYAADATKPDDIAAAFDAAATANGAPSILVNNAGGTESAPFAEESLERWTHNLTFNLTSVFIATKAALPAMLDAGYGRVINMASTAGLTGYAYVPAYCAAKHGVIGLTRSLALEVARKGVTVNAVCPGYTRTPMVEDAIDKVTQESGQDRDKTVAAFARRNPQKRLIEPDEVADPVLWLALPGSSSINGQAIAVAGGEVM